MMTKFWFFWMNCSFKFVVFLRSSVLRINGVCSALMTACSRADANVRCNLLLLITLFFNCARSPFLSLSLSVPMYFLFTMSQNSFTASCSLFSLQSSIWMLDCTPTFFFADLCVQTNVGYSSSLWHFQLWAVVCTCVS